jgi:hypothetical protein
MSRQLQANKELLIIGDSNVERNILHTGRLYCQLAESVPAQNLNELGQAVVHIQPNKHKAVVFAMLTNIVISAGNSISTLDSSARRQPLLESPWGRMSDCYSLKRRITQIGAG